MASADTQSTQAPRSRWRPPKVPPSLAARLTVLGAVFVLLLFLALLGVIRYFGLPHQAAIILKEQLQRQGIEASFGKLYLDPLGRIIGRDVEVSKLAESDQHRFTVERVRFDVNWLSWWRGEPLVAGVVLEEADLRYALDPETAIELSRVRIDLTLARGKLTIRYGRFFLGPIEFKISGVIRGQSWDFPEPAPLTEDERARRAELWRHIETHLHQLRARSGLTVHLKGDLDLDDPSSSRLRAWMDARQVSLHEHVVRQVAWSMDYAEERAELAATFGIGRGQLELAGLWFWDATNAKLEFRSTIDLSLLSVLVPGPLGQKLSQLTFRTLPLLSGELDINWAETFEYSLRLNADWRDFSIQEADFEHLHLPLAYDGTRLLITDLTLTAPSGQLAASWFMDENRKVQAKIQSTLDPTTLKGLFGPGAQPFFNSLQFTQGPELTARISGTGLDPEAWAIRGSLRAANFRYKNVPLQEINGDFVYNNGKIYSPRVLIRRPEGTGEAEVWHDFRHEMVWLRNGRSTLNLGEIATVFGDVFASYVTPYRFLKPPAVQVSGLVDLKTQQKTDLTATILSPEGMHFDFLGKEILAENLNATLTLRGPRLEIVPNQPARLFNGQLRGPIRLDLSTTPARFRAELDLLDWQFDQLMRTYFGGEDDLGGKLSGSLTVEGQLDVLDSITGGGQLTVREGALYRIPIYGAFSQVLNVFIPGLGFAKASNAKADFRFDQGHILIDSVDIYSLSAVMIGRGRYDYINDNVDMDMRVNVRGPIGLVFFPVSKLFEYHGTGPLNDTKWEAKIFE